MEKNILYKLMWHLVHTLYTLCILIYGFFKRLESAFIELKNENKNSTDILVNINQETRNLKQIPTHLTVLLGTEKPSFIKLAKLIAWSLASGISYISFYDIRGDLVSNESELVSQVEKEIPKTYHVIWHNKEENYKNGFTGPKIYVKIFTPNDGRGSIVETCKELINSKEINIEVVDNHLKKRYQFPDPSLGFYFGDYFNLYGYPPWQIRLTEFLNVPNHHSLNDQKFIQLLHRYNKCEQRVGK